MNTTVAIQKIDEATAALKLARAELVATTPNTNLLSFMANAAANSTINLPPDYIHSGAIDVIKPLTIKGGKIIGPVHIKAPDVHLEGVGIQGMNKDHTLLTLGDRSLILDCALQGHMNGQHGGIRAESVGAIIRRVKVTGIYDAIDTWGISGDNGTKNLLVEDSSFEAAGMGLIFGGSDASSEANIPENILVQRCKFTKDFKWKSLPGSIAKCKNGMELKNVKHFKAIDCEIVYSWNSGQIGFGVVITTRNQRGGNPYAIIEDAIFENLRVSKCAGGVQIQGTDNIFPSKTLKGLTFRKAYFTEINPTLYGLNGRCIQMSRGGEDITFDDFSFEGTDLNTFLTFGEGSPTFKNLKFLNGKVYSGEYGIKGDNAPGLGKAALDLYAPGHTWQNMTVKNTTSQPVKWPVGTIIT